MNSPFTMYEFSLAQLDDLFIYLFLIFFLKVNFVVWLRFEPALIIGINSAIKARGITNSSLIG